MSILVFELKKIMYTRTFPLFLLLTILAICGLFIHTVIMQDTARTKKVEPLSTIYQSIIEQNLEDYAYIQENGLDPDTLERIATGQELQTNLEMVTNEIQYSNWTMELLTERQIYYSAMHYEELGGTFGMSNDEIEAGIELTSELISLNIAKEHLDYSTQPPLFMKKVISFFLNSLWYFVFLISLMAYITKECGGQPKQMVHALPISETNNILIKMVALVLAGTTWLVTVFGLSYALPMIFTEPKEFIFSYPLIHAAGGLVEVSSYLKDTAFMSMSLIIFTCALLLLIAYRFRQTFKTYLVISLIFLSYFIVTDVILTPTLYPFTFQTIDRIVLSFQFSPIGEVILLVTACLLLYVTITYQHRRRL
ncbi:hypothetical protein [Alkalicoccobacillus murimartini]|uniref:ABC transporter permease n=1 Tax=Alkalicoccobacillus murimartini TaxID=171685 RepID=A0ABT9YKW6_9BACI|nr:hypothetical protein [Alkalicoccobacillus murimartini]MDQ0208391.1 hypothetical protein [Alkalicoccobacillus murimartini]